MKTEYWERQPSLEIEAKPWVSGMTVKGAGGVRFVVAEHFA